VRRLAVPLEHVPVTSVQDPRLAMMGEESVAGADQIPSLLAATPDERLDRLIAVLQFVADGRAALRKALARAPTP